MTKAEINPVPLDPDTFDLDAWLDGANPVSRSCVIYQRGDLMAELDEIERAIEVRKAAEPGGAVSDPELEALEQQWAQTAQQLKASAITVTLRALTDAEMQEINAAHVVPEKGEDESDEDYAARALDALSARGYAMLAKAIQSPPMTVEQLRRLEERIGPAQFDVLTTAMKQARNVTPAVKAPFSRRSSTGQVGVESSQN